jgi:hypothetical protein
MDDDPCDPDQIDMGAYCIASPSGAAGGPGGAGGAAGAAATGTGDFGAACDTDAECADPAPRCAAQPGAEAGICTVYGCIATPALCPAGWHCLDLSLMGPEYPDLCVPD